MLILAVILIPSAQQVQKRMSATPYGTPAIGTPPSGIEAPPMEMEIPSYEEPQMTPELEDYSEIPDAERSRRFRAETRGRTGS